MMSTFFRFACLAALVTALGCNALTPKTYQLEQIHQTYTEEWVHAELPRQGATPPGPSNAGAFKGTLAAIQNFKATYGGDGPIGDHLTILEGMVHLQSGNIGMARLLEREMVRKADRPATSVVMTRDQLIAACFPALVDGWEAIVDRSLDPARFSGAADAIAAKLQGLEWAERAAAELDSGGAYLATSAAIFYLWSSDRDPVGTPMKTAAQKGADVLRPWLHPLEIEDAEARDLGSSETKWGSRQRFVDWHAWLHAKARAE